MHFGCVEFVEQHGSTRSSRRALHVERVVSKRDVTAKWNFGLNCCGYTRQNCWPEIGVRHLLSTAVVFIVVRSFSTR